MLKKFFEKPYLIFFGYEKSKTHTQQSAHCVTRLSVIAWTRLLDLLCFIRTSMSEPSLTLPSLGFDFFF